MVSVSDTIVLENKNLSVTLSVKDGLVISSIYDKLNEHEYLFNENHLFRYSITTNLTIGGYESEGTFDSSIIPRISLFRIAALHIGSNTFVFIGYVLAATIRMQDQRFFDFSSCLSFIYCFNHAGYFQCV